jgi:tetratricopeptide (TPR) repeat protein
LTALRVHAGWTQGQLARANGISASLLSVFETGGKHLSRERLEELVAPLGEGPDAIEETLLYLGTLRAEAAPEPPGSPFELSLSERRQLRRAAAVVARAAQRSAYAELAGTRRQALVQEQLSRAKLSWRRLARAAAAERRAMVEGPGEEAEAYRTWGVCVLVCEASVSAAADRAPRAVELAELALLVAERVSGTDLWRARVQGYAWAFVGNARRVANDLSGAERAFATARELWEAGAAADPGALDPSRLLDLEASLRRDQRRWAEALALLDQALAASPSPERSGRILLNKAFTHEQRGDCEEAIAALQEAAPLVDPAREPRQACVLRFNLAVNLCHQGRHAEAEPLVAAARELAVALRNDTDLVKVLWLEARVHAGLGRRAEAIAALRQVREDFAERKLAGDAALATLNLAVVLLEEGRTAEVRALAGETLPVFGSLGLGGEALAALRVFWQAAEQETATADLGRRLLAFLERARYDPDLRFDLDPTARASHRKPGR